MWLSVRKWLKGSVGFGEGAVAHREEAGGAAERGEQRGIGAGDPDLAVEPG